MSAAPGEVTLRPLRADDFEEMLEMWVTAWQAAYPAIDFSARRNWAAQHFAELKRSGSRAIVAERDGKIVGALAVNPHSGYLDQLVVATEAQRGGIASLLLAHARGLSPERLSLHVNRDNMSAIRFYEGHGFIRAGEEINPLSGASIFRMEWRRRS